MALERKDQSGIDVYEVLDHLPHTISRKDQVVRLRLSDGTVLGDISSELGTWIFKDPQSTNPNPHYLHEFSGIQDLWGIGGEENATITLDQEGNKVTRISVRDKVKIDRPQVVGAIMSFKAEGGVGGESEDGSLRILAEQDSHPILFCVKKAGEGFSAEFEVSEAEPDVYERVEPSSPLIVDVSSVVRLAIETGLSLGELRCEEGNGWVYADPTFGESVSIAPEFKIGRTVGTSGDDDEFEMNLIAPDAVRIEHAFVSGLHSTVSVNERGGITIQDNYSTNGLAACVKPAGTGFTERMRFPQKEAEDKAKGEEALQQIFGALFAKAGLRETIEE